MTTPAIVLSVLLAAEPSANDPPFEIADVESASVDRSANLLMFDRDGEVAADVTTWIDADGRPRIDAVWPDGVYLSIVDGVAETNDATAAARRAEAIDDFLAENEQLASWQEWALCGGHLALAALECPTALGCGLGIIGSFCHCGPLIDEDIDCTP